MFASKSEQLGEPVMKMLEGQVMLRMIDTRWMAHLQEMDYLKAGIGLRAFGQRDPLVEYKNEAYNAFQNLTAGMYEDYLRCCVSGGREASPNGGQEPARRKGELLVSRAGSRADGRGRRAQAGCRVAERLPTAGSRLKPAAAKPQTYTKDKDDPFANVGRNEPCRAARASSTSATVDLWDHG